MADQKQIEKNTVSAKNQMKDCKYIRFVNPKGKGRRIMFVGNSITIHGVRPAIGWHRECGMAATGEEKDYVHLVMDAVKKQDPDAAFCITQISRWEINYNKDYQAAIELHEAGRDFEADVLIIRCVENCPWAEYEPEQFKQSYKAMIDYLNKKNGQVILTTSFWESKADEAIRQVGQERGYPVIYLGDLGERDDMKAIGQFEHQGVCQHPNDNGMRKIATRIIKCL